MADLNLGLYVDDFIDMLPHVASRARRQLRVPGAWFPQEDALGISISGDYARQAADSKLGTPVNQFNSPYSIGFRNSPNEVTMMLNGLDRQNVGSVQFYLKNLNVTQQILSGQITRLGLHINDNTHAFSIGPADAYPDFRLYIQESGVELEAKSQRTYQRYQDALTNRFRSVDLDIAF